MSLFVGNISKNIRTRDIEDSFDRYGKCSINHKVHFIFERIGKLCFHWVWFRKRRWRRTSRTTRKGHGWFEHKHRYKYTFKFCLEWSKRSGRFKQSDSKRPQKYLLPNQYEQIIGSKTGLILSALIVVKWAILLEIVEAIGIREADLEIETDMAIMTEADTGRETEIIASKTMEITSESIIKNDRQVLLSQRKDVTREIVTVKAQKIRKFMIISKLERTA